MFVLSVLYAVTSNGDIPDVDVKSQGAVRQERESPATVITVHSRGRSERA